MNILINKEKIDFTLQNEQTLGEVVKGVEEWIRQSNFIITSLKADNRELMDEPKEKWDKLPLSSIEGLDIKAELLKEVKHANLETVYSFLNILKNGLEKKDQDSISQILSNYNYGYMIASLKNIFGRSVITNIGQVILEIEKLLTGSTVEILLNWPAGIKTKMLNSIDYIQEKLQDRLKEYATPAESLKETAAGLKHSALEIGEVSLLLQTGKDTKAMEYIIRFSELTEKASRLFTLLQDDGIISLENDKIGNNESVIDFFKGLNDKLNELINAFMVKDLVLIGDLLEYEIAPRIEQLVGFIARD